MRATRTLGMLLSLLCCMGSVLAQQPFTYQGMLKTSGIPANGNYDFQFSLWTTNAGGSQVGSTITRIGVSNGLFTAELDFGNVWDGNDRYLQIAVRPSGSGSYTTLSPRAKVNRVPYSQLSFGALSVPWSGITGMPAGFADGVDNDTTYLAGAGLQLSGNTFSIANVGVVSAMLADGSVVTSKIADGAVTTAKLANGAVSSAKLADGAVTTAKIGDAQVTDAKIACVSWSKVTGAPSSFPPSGSAGGDLSGNYPNPTVAKLQGRAVSSTAPSAGQVLKWDGSTWSPSVDLSGSDLWQASGSSIFYTAGNVGIGTNNPLHRLHVETSAGDRAIYGLHTASSGTNFGVFGQSASSTGTGVFGLTTATSGTTVGVTGRSESTTGTGVYGEAVAASGFAVGVTGRSASPEGVGVFGWAAANSGVTNGVYGRSDSTAGAALKGDATATSGVTYGVFGQSASPSGVGVHGVASATSGITFGVRGVSLSPAGYGGYFLGRGYFSGNVGIGTETPDYILDVNGRTRIRGGTGTNTAGVWFSNGTSDRTFIGLVDDNNVGVWGQAGAGWHLVMRTDTGNVRIGPSVIETGKLNVSTDSTATNATLRLHEIGNDGPRIEFTNSANTARKWHIWGYIGAAVADDRLNFWNSQAGDILSVRGDGTVSVKVLEITGADLAEKFPTTDAVEPGMVLEIDPDNPGYLRKARGAYNQRVAGVVAGANGLSKGVILGNLENSEQYTPIAISGRVWVYADATEHAIEPGALLTTSDKPGYAMAVRDRERTHGAVLGKAMTGLEKGKTGMVLVLVNLQ